LIDNSRKGLLARTWNPAPRPSIIKVNAKDSEVKVTGKKRTQAKRRVIVNTWQTSVAPELCPTFSMSGKAQYLVYIPSTTQALSIKVKVRTRNIAENSREGLVRRQAAAKRYKPTSGRGDGGERTKLATK